MNYFSFSCSRTLVLSDGSILPLSQVHDHCKHSSSACRCDACQRHHGGFCTYFTKRGHSRSQTCLLLQSPTHLPIRFIALFYLPNSITKSHGYPAGYTTQSHLTRGNIKHNIHINSEITLHLYRRRTTQLTRLGNNNLAYQIEKDQFKSPD